MSRPRGSQDRGLVMGLAGLVVVGLLMGLLANPAEAGLKDKFKKKERLDQPADGAVADQQAPPPGVYEGPKKIIAVTKFKSTSGIGWDTGEALGAILSDSLMKTNRFEVVERAEVDDIIGEQDLGAEGRTTIATAPKVGQMLGASLLVMGAVTQFEQNASSGGGGIGIPIPYVGSARLGGAKVTAYVKINLRLVDTTTGKIVATANADGTASGKSAAAGAYIEGFSFDGEGAKEEPLAKAAEDAINQAVAFITEHMNAVPFYARVAEVEGGTVYINAGANRNMKPDMVLQGYKVTKEIKDPDTGLVIDAVEEKTGSVKITEVKDKISIATIVEGAVEKGQKLRLE